MPWRLDRDSLADTSLVRSSTSTTFVRALSLESARLNHRPVKIVDRSSTFGCREQNEFRYETAYSSACYSRYRFYRIPRLSIIVPGLDHLNFSVY